MSGTAVGALHNTIGPAQFRHEGFAVVEILKVDDGFLKCAGCFHESSMPEITW
jgi:hypothetical protein